MRRVTVIFSQTLATEEEIDDIFEWVDNHPLLEKKAGIITSYYRRLLKPEVTKKELYMAMVASVFLESYLFYSGFFYPLYLAGQGKLTASGEIINLIIRDESIHGVFVGILAQQNLRGTFCRRSTRSAKRNTRVINGTI